MNMKLTAAQKPRLEKSGCGVAQPCFMGPVVLRIDWLPNYLQPLSSKTMEPKESTTNSSRHVQATYGTGCRDEELM